MEKQTTSTNYVPLQPSYNIIKHGNKIGVQIGTQVVTIAGGTPFKIETHTYPVVAAEDRITALKDNNHHIDGSSEGEVWDNVESRQVSILCKVGVCLEWQQFIKILWHDHARLGDHRLPINKVHIFQKIVHYNNSMMLPSPGLYTIHLRSVLSADGTPSVVRSSAEDVFALNVVWTDDLGELEQRMVGDLKEYLLILSPNRSAHYWHMRYETDEERLHPLVERLNANSVATSFNKTLMGVFHVTALPSYGEENVQPSSSPSCNNTPLQRGAHKKVFEDFLHHDAPEKLMSVLEDMMSGVIDARKAFAIILAITNVYIDEPTNKSVCERFKKVTETPYGRAKAQHYGRPYYKEDFSTNPSPIKENELERIREEIKKRLKEKG